MSNWCSWGMSLVVVVGVLASAGCGGKKQASASPVEAWSKAAGERRVGVVIVYDIPTEANMAIIAEQLPASHLVIDLKDSPPAARFGYTEGELGEPVALNNPKLLAAISSARGILLTGSFSSNDSESETDRYFFLALQSRHSAGVPIAVASILAGEPSLDGRRSIAELSQRFDQSFENPRLDFWPYGLVLWSASRPRFATIVDDLALSNRHFAVIEYEDAPVIIDLNSNRISTRGNVPAPLLDFTDAKLKRKGRQVENARLNILCPGDTFDLAERRVGFAAGKTLHGSTNVLPMEKYEHPTDPDTIVEMAARLADSAPGSTLAADFGPDGLLILTRDAETVAYRTLVKGDGEKNAKPEIIVGPNTPWTISRLRLDIVPAPKR